jgi:hypothetical protein
MEMRFGGKGALKAAAEAEQAEIAAAASLASDHDDAPSAGTGRKEIPEALIDSAKQLLAAMPLEDAIRMLEEEYGEAISIRDLIEMVGAEVYEEALQREAREFQANMISPDQIALLWNESGIIRPSGGMWTEHDIQALLA